MAGPRGVVRQGPRVCVPGRLAVPWRLQQVSQEHRGLAAVGGALHALRTIAHIVRLIIRIPPPLLSHCPRASHHTSHHNRRYSTSESPQAVFLLVGSFPIAQAWLVAMGCGVLLYCLWRLSEGVTGQGWRSTARLASNVFRYRVSPLVSGAVYLSYAVYVFELMDRAVSGGDGDGGGDTPSDNGDEEQSMPTVALAFLLAVAFLAAFLSQLVQAVRPLSQFVQELDPGKLRGHPHLRPALIWVGRAGFCGRAIVFMLVSVLMWKVVAGTLSSDEESRRGSIMTRALLVLHQSTAGRVFCECRQPPWRGGFGRRPAPPPPSYPLVAQCL
jgi:hypothetical protein